jgi:hypothetical protein
MFLFIGKLQVISQKIIESRFLFCKFHKFWPILVQTKKAVATFTILSLVEKECFYGGHNTTTENSVW